MCLPCRKIHEQIREVLRLCREEKPVFVSGKRQQSSCQRQRIQRRDHSDGPKHEEIRVEGEEIHARAGALLSLLLLRARNASLTGFEFAGGIPGTIGGAAVMNAGAYGGELKDVLKRLL